MTSHLAPSHLSASVHRCVDRPLPTPGASWTCGCGAVWTVSAVGPIRWELA